ncbi:hypothetical protein AK812_SmicGene2714 [Symbiodinium microadriaticum]|uniref:Uncharacterized protein n=1 Tax=Symbiodinium microadriaticum TaxID=2951 RepID=A0A1Q9F147_SYMMI|nr:hypothetical protein AK812_SmicGene2714 [Symbiodinium microadriaticum]
MGKPLARPLSAMSQMSDIKAKETLLPAALLTQHPADSWKVSPILPIKPVAPKKVEEAVEQAAGNLEEEKIPSRQNDAEYGDEYGDDWEEEPEEEEAGFLPVPVLRASFMWDAPAIDSIKAAATPNNNNLTGHSEMKTEKDRQDLRRSITFTLGLIGSRANAAPPEPAAPAPKMSTEDDYEDEDFEDASQDDIPAETVGDVAARLVLQVFWSGMVQDIQLWEHLTKPANEFPCQEQVSEELQEERTEPSGGQQASEAVARAASPAEVTAQKNCNGGYCLQGLTDTRSIGSAAATGRESDYSDEPFEEQASEQLEDKPLKPAAGAPAPEVTVGAASPLEAKAELEAEAVPSEPSIRSAEEQASEQLEDKPLKPAAGAPAPEVTVGAASPLEAKAELEAEAVPSEPSIRSAEEMPSEKSKDKTQSMQEGQPTPDATARAPSSVEANWSEGGGERVGFRLKVVLAGISLTQAKPELEVEAVPSEPSIRSAEASPVDQSSDYGGYGSEDFEQDPADKHGSGGPAAVPGATAKDVSSDRSAHVSPTGKYSDYADEPFEEQLSAELQEGMPERSGGQQLQGQFLEYNSSYSCQQVPEVDVHTPSPAEAAMPSVRNDFHASSSGVVMIPMQAAPLFKYRAQEVAGLMADVFLLREQASEELEDKPLKPAAGDIRGILGFKLDNKLQAAENVLDAKAELEAEAVPSEPSIRSAEASPVSPGSDYGDEEFEEMPSEKLEDKAQKPLEGQPTPDASARAPSSAEANWSEGGGERVGFRPLFGRASDPASPVDESSDYGGYGSEDFEQDTELQASPAGSDYEDEPFEEQVSAELQEQLSEELEESPTESPGGPVAPEIMGRATSPTEEEEISEELEDVAEPSRPAAAM